MAHLLYYWRSDNYRRDRRFGFGYHLNQDSPALSKTTSGDSVWAFTQRADKTYVLAAHLIVKAVTTNRRGYRYGAKRIWADLELSRYFRIDEVLDTEQLVRSLTVRAQARLLGQSFQGHAAVRPLTVADHDLLTAFARHLATETDLAIYPEDEFEARLFLGDRAGASVAREAAHVDSRRYRYLHETHDPQRSRRHVLRLQELYGGRCQLCLFDPKSEYTHHLCHGHHIEWLSRGGEDALDNMMLVCPNHHAAIHRTDAPFDFASLTFSFPGARVEPLRLDRHLGAAG